MFLCGLCGSLAQCFGSMARGPYQLRHGPVLVCCSGCNSEEGVSIAEKERNGVFRGESRMGCFAGYVGPRQLSERWRLS